MENLTILIIEKNADLLNIFSELIAVNCKQKVYSVQTIEQAEKILTEITPNVIIYDFAFDVLPNGKLDSLLHRQIPVIGLTTQNIDIVKNNFKLIKMPFELDHFEQTLRGFCKEIEFFL